MLIETATIMEVSIAVVGIIGALAGLIKSSACRVIRCGLQGFQCIRHQTKGERLETEEEVAGGKTNISETELTSKSPNPITTPQKKV